MYVIKSHNFLCRRMKKNWLKTINFLSLVFKLGKKHMKIRIYLLQQRVVVTLADLWQK